ncbi:MAG: alpha-D-ribose 1-methylphosphonate 5-triphosphate diphosphatase, partial [Actinomycetota bacterium]|nr:alpha-D-ribose 1-methylphosphonate 5-triphosphate diphosphatase [Actinomycetota bacterium]
MTAIQTPGDLSIATRGSYVLTDVRAAIGARIVDQLTIEVVNGTIISIGEGRHPGGALDGSGLLLVPGLVDTHSDGLEKEANPRRTAHFPIDYAIQAFEGRLRSSGITTVFHGVGYQEKPRSGRSIERARALNQTINERRQDPTARVDHRVLFRLEARDDSALAPLLEDLEQGKLGSQPLVSFEDHTPGQGQYRDPARFAAALDPEDIPEGLTAQQHVDDIMAEAERHLVTRQEIIEKLGPLAANGTFRLLAHDMESAADVAAAAAFSAAIAEFPLTVESARAAKEAGMTVVMGAPNALRGSSHSGNASARELIAAGLCDVLASDYLPPAMLSAAFVMAAEGTCSLPRALHLITAGPADLAGLE